MERRVFFNSDGIRIAGILFEPEATDNDSCPAIMLCQGMVGVKEYFWFPHLARRLVELGCVALIWDYRGVGESEGEPGRLYPLEQVEDIRNGLTFLETNPKVDPERLGLMGFSFGAGMVPYVAGIDERVKCSISVAGWGDGERWMQSIRRYYEWLDLLNQIEDDRKTRIETGMSEMVSGGGILVGDPATAAARQKVIDQIPEMENYKGTSYSLATAEKLLDFKPISVVERISPRAIMYIAAELDSVTPAEGVVGMYEETYEPKKLWVIPGATHYDVYREDLKEQIWDMSVAWFKEYLRID